MKHALCKSVIFGVLLLTSCTPEENKKPPVKDDDPPVQSAPNKAIINGLNKVDRASGVVELSVSALKNDALVDKGVISDVSATVDSITSASSKLSVTPESCGDISRKNSITAIMTLDGSGSMRWNDNKKLRNTAAKKFVSRMSESDRSAIAWFSRVFKMEQVITSDKALMNKGINRATKNVGVTDLWGASIKSIQYLASLGDADNKIAIVLADGEDTEKTSTPQKVIDEANKSKIRMFMIFLGSGLGEKDKDKFNMINVASNTGGLYARVETASNLNNLFDKSFNAAKSEGCLRLTFSPVPAKNTKISGTISFKVNQVSFSEKYEVSF